jgi:hypothetical protein
MRATAQIDDLQIDEMELDITFRMKVSEWRALMRQQDVRWPASGLGMRIASVLGHLTTSTNMIFTEPLHLALHADKE